MKSIFRTFLWKLLSVAVGLAAAGALAAAFGKGPSSFYGALWAGAFGSEARLVATVAKMVPLVLAGLAVAVPFAAGLFNIGGEGQMYLGATASVAVALALGGLLGALALPAALLAGLAAGAAWGAVAGILKARRGVHEVISTIMLNFIALYAVAWLVNSGPIADPRGLGRTSEIPGAVRLPMIFERGVHGVSAGLIIALAAAPAAWWLVARSVTGFRMRAAGTNLRAASRKGISVGRMTLVAMAAGGAFAGCAGALEVTGSQYSVSAAFSPGYGFDGIAVALVAGANPLAVPAAAFLFAAIRAAGPMLQLDAGLSPQMIYVVEAAIIIAAAVPSAPRVFGRVLRVHRAASAIGEHM